MSPLDRKVVRDLLHLRGQVVAIVLVVASGLALFVAMRSMHAYLVNSQQEYYRDYRFAEVFAHVKRAPQSVARRAGQIAGVEASEARVVVDVLVDVAGLREPATARLISIPAQRAPVLNDLVLRSGRWIGPDRRDEVLVSEAFAEANQLRPGDTIGAVINGRWQDLRIVGTALSPEYVYEIGGAASIFPDNRRFGVMWMGEASLQAAFDMEGGFNDLSLILLPEAAEPEVIAQLDRLLQPYGGLGAFGRDDQVSHRFVSDEIAETQVTSLLIPGIFLGITTFLLHIVMSRLVSTQREQIGLLKAFGYSSRSVAVHFLKMAAVPVLLGAAVGALLGFWWAVELAEVYARFFRFPAIAYRPDLGLAAWSLGIALVFAGAGAVGAVRRAAGMPPAEAMRPPSPAQYRPGLVERLRLQRWLAPGTRIVVRNLERAPLKTALAVLGLALAVAMVLCGLFMFDAIDFMKAVQFHEVQRGDLTVAFREPVGRDVTPALWHLPGVTRAEVFRSAPVVMRAGHLSERTTIFGLLADGELYRLVDTSRRVHRLPSGGLTLTSALAGRLGVGVGESVIVEVMEGARPTLEIRVAHLVDEVIGSAAYMPLESLWGAIDGDRGVSGAFLAVDSTATQELFDRLKRMPAVGAVGVRQAMLQSFERTIAESFYISLGSMVFFACVIAVGMVYNGARIALSERGRELASLRVLGCSRREVAAMLLLEQGFLLLAALPLGLAIGYGLAALITWRFQMELFRIPLVVSVDSMVLSCLIVVASAAASAWVVRRRLDRIDLVSVLKTRE